MTDPAPLKNRQWYARTLVNKKAEGYTPVHVTSYITSAVEWLKEKTNELKAKACDCCPAGEGLKTACDKILGFIDEAFADVISTEQEEGTENSTIDDVSLDEDTTYEK